MKRAFAVVLVFAASAVAEDPKPIAFGKMDVGKLPAGWTVAKTGTGDGSVWKVATDGTAPGTTGYTLAQAAAGPSKLFNLCVLDGSKFQDGEVSVAVKAVDGKIDQGGGLVWRYADADNYYVCRYNPIELNLRLYHIKDGKRTQLATKGGAEREGRGVVHGVGQARRQGHRMLPRRQETAGGDGRDVPEGRQGRRLVEGRRGDAL